MGDAEVQRPTCESGDDELHMRRAIELAKRGSGRTSPNPIVGCVVVRDGEVVGEGFHAAAGEPHAEILALRGAASKAEGATVYTSLEPCCTQGRTPPCTDALISARVGRVVAATLDPNPNVSGRGLTRLRDAGLEVARGLLAEEAAALNETYSKWITTGVPFVTAKWAMSLDGKIAAERGSRTHLTGMEANALVHEMRSACDAVVVGVGTVLADDPELTARLGGGRGAKTPLRVVVDGTGSTPVDSTVVRTARDVPTVVAMTEDAGQDAILVLEEAGVEVMKLNGADGWVDMLDLMRALGRRQVTSVLLEGGAKLHASAFAAGLVDKVVCFVTPKVLASGGGLVAVEPVPGVTGEIVVELENVDVRRVEDDVMISGYVTGRGAR